MKNKRINITYNLEDPQMAKEAIETLKIKEYQLILWELSVQNRDIQEIISEITEEYVKECGKPKTQEDLNDLISSTICRLVNHLAEKYGVVYDE